MVMRKFLVYKLMKKKLIKCLKRLILMEVVP
jgi:hypothetical protein